MDFSFEFELFLPVWFACLFVVVVCFCFFVFCFVFPEPSSLERVAVDSQSMILEMALNPEGLGISNSLY